MQPDSLYLKDPASALYLSGGRGEAESLLGTPLPVLPRPELERGKSIFFVRFHPQLRTLAQRFLAGLYKEMGADAAKNTPSPGASREQTEYEAALVRMLSAVMATDRRQGLINLCWLAHSMVVAETLCELEAKGAGARRLRHSLQPLLSNFYRRAEQAALRALEHAQPGRWAFLNGECANTALVDTIIEDGLSLTETGIDGLDLKQYLPLSKRYRLSAELFTEIHGILLRETERRLREGDRGLQARIIRHIPGLTREQAFSQAGRVMLNPHVLGYLLSDPWTTGGQLLASSKLKAEAERRRASEVLDVFQDLVQGVKRFEIVCHLRSQIAVMAGGEAELARVSSGYRIYEFSDSPQVLNNGVDATVLFLDLRGFTRTSEGQVSARDLTRELYTVFDAFVPHIRRFGGTVDKFLGDGIMVTYGTEQSDPLGPLNALRTAVLCQEAIIRFRREGKTYFKMGVSVHYGRVYIARFIADDANVQTTVIGRNVNLAGRLSSAAKKPMDADEGVEPTPANPGLRDLVVTVDEGTLLNEGIAISRDALLQLEAKLDLSRAETEHLSVIEYLDKEIGRRLFIRHVGDARFKGVSSSLPVYEVDFVRSS